MRALAWDFAYFRKLTGRYGPVERAGLETALRNAAPRIWGLIGPSAERIPEGTRTLIDRAVLRLCDGVAEYLTVGDLSAESESEIRAFGLALSRMIAWDVIDELNKAYVQTAVGVVAQLEVADVGVAARAVVSVSDALYDGFWVYNNHEGFEQALRLGALIDHFPSPTFMLDEFGALTFANEALCAAFDATVGELDGCKLEDLVVSEGRSLLSDPESNVSVKNKGGETTHFRLSTTRIDTSEGTEFFGQLIDRTGEVRLERTKQQVIATISHELRTPLTAVVGYAELLHGGGRGGPIGEADKAEAMGVIYEQARHLLDLVTDLVDFARLDTGRIGVKEAEVDLRSAVDAVIRRVGVSDDIRLTMRIPHRTLLWADRVRIEQLLTNFITNAIRYGGPEITIDAWAAGTSTVMIRFADNGEGIPSADRPRIFESFYQGDQTHVGVGTGMGLAICQAIVRAHHGSIALEDRPGASFLMTLPVAP